MSWHSGNILRVLSVLSLSLFISGTFGKSHTVLGAHLHGLQKEDSDVSLPGLSIRHVMFLVSRMIAETQLLNLPSSLSSWWLLGDSKA